MISLAVKYRIRYKQENLNKDIYLQVVLDVVRQPVREYLQMK